MRFEIDLQTFRVGHAGECQLRRSGVKALYVSPTLRSLTAIDQLGDAEYGQAIEVDAEQRAVRFGRDYLGHFPLFYGCTPTLLCIADDVQWIIGRLRASGVQPTLHEEALALYFAMGYVPAGMTIHREIVACEPHTIYEWRRGAVRGSSIFAPVEIDPSCGLPDLEQAIEMEVARQAAGSREIDVWCSGGLDSSIMACLFNERGRAAELLTLGYGTRIHERYGDGERSYAYEVAAHCGVRVREAELTEESFGRIHERFVELHPMPAIETCVPPKYALAESSRALVITGEGGDPVFGAPKNNAMMFAASQGAASLGWHYAMTHDRCFPVLGKLLRRGRELTGFVVDYMEAVLGRYPGDLLRRLFYLNMHFKAASLTLAESYYACRAQGVVARHPYAALSVYRTAFALEDRHKYRYPRNKLALYDLYSGRLPSSVVNRAKVGTVLPLPLYLASFAPAKFQLDQLRETGLFQEDFLDGVARARNTDQDERPLYGLVTLNEWLGHRERARPTPKQSPESADILVEVH